MNVESSPWLEKYLEKVSRISPEGHAAVDYIRAHRTRINLRRARPGVGAFWTIRGAINLNSFHYTYESTLTQPRAWTSLIHEVRHLQQGFFTALSVYGELEAWQTEYRVYFRLLKLNPTPALEELLSLTVNWDRANLRLARDLMIQHAGRGYRIDLLPLYPLPLEIKYVLTGRILLSP
jgi:hypothetical protein